MLRCDMLNRFVIVIFALLALAPIIVWYFTDVPVLTAMQLLISALLFWRHRSNIQNLLSGREEKMRSKKNTAT